MIWDISEISIQTKLWQEGPLIALWLGEREVPGARLSEGKVGFVRSCVGWARALLGFCSGPEG